MSFNTVCRSTGLGGSSLHRINFLTANHGCLLIIFANSLDQDEKKVSISNDNVIP